MLNLYLTHKAFIDGFEGSHAELSSLVKGDNVIIYAADQILLDNVKQPETKEFRYAKSSGIVPRSGTAVTETLKTAPKLKLSRFSSSLASSLFIVNIDKNRCKEIGDKLGVLCIPDSETGTLLHSNDKFKTYTFNQSGGWQDVISEISDTPVNSIIINDRFLATNERNDYENLKELILQIFKNKHYDFAIHILIIYGIDSIRKENPNEIIQRMSNAINKTGSSLGLNFVQDYIFCDNKDMYNWPLFDYTHNRFLMSNYHMVSAEKQLSAFRNGVAVAFQTLYYASQLASDDSRCKWHIYRREIASIINDASDRESRNKLISEDSPYKPICPYLCMRVTNDNQQKQIDMTEINNRLITDLQDGDPCWYLSVGQDNDWANAKVLPKDRPIIFDSKNFSKCLCSKSRAELEVKAKEIQAIFSDTNFHYEQVKEKDKTYFKVYVSYPSDIQTINYEESKINTLDQYTKYHNNCFLKEDDAIEVANKICDVLRIPHISRHE